VADVDGEIEDGSARNANQLGLGMGWDLVKQTPDGTGLRREHMIVLHEPEMIQTGSLPSAFAVGLGKKSPLITMPIRREHEDFRNLE